MNTGRIFLVGFVALVSMIGIAAIQDYSVEEKPVIQIEELPTEVDKITVSISDGVGSGDNG